MQPAPLAGGRWSRRAALPLVALLTLLLHAWVMDQVGDAIDAARPDAAPARLQAAFVRELQPTESAAPVAPAAVPPPLPRPPQHAALARPLAASEPGPHARADDAERTAPDAATASASAPVKDEPEPNIAADAASAASAATAPASEADRPRESASVASAAELAVAAAPPLPASAASAPSFAWPPSTRLSYKLRGWVRGEVEGRAEVQWLSAGPHYQVHLDVIVGAPFAPLMQRHMSSDGAITPQGLSPRRYDEQTQVAFGRTRQATVRFEADGVTLADGRRVEAPPALQDSASQFVQLTYLFATGTRGLQPGVQVEIPLALARRVDRWVYEVVGEEQLATPFGALAAWHLIPRRLGDPSALRVEAWFAPSLQYLPVRIVIRQGEQDYLELTVDRLPQQGAAAHDGARR